MAPRTTRSKAAPQTTLCSESAAPKLERNDDEQRRLFVLPRDASPDAKIISLPNPSTSIISRYFFCPDKGLYEFSTIAAPKDSAKSWLIAEDPKRKSLSDADPNVSEDVPTSTFADTGSLKSGYMLESADLFVATQIDPLFFLLSLFKPSILGDKASFRLGDDYVDMLSKSSRELRLLLRKESFQELLLKRLEFVSEVQRLGDDVLYRPDVKLLVQQIEEKASRMSGGSIWPAAMEETFVKRQLTIPFVSLPRTNTQLPTPEQSMTEETTESRESQSQNATIFDEQAENENENSKGSDESCNTLEVGNSLDFTRVKELMRLRVATNYILSSYFPLALREPFRKILASNTRLDFKPLDEHLAEVAKAKDQVQALRSISDNMSRKRSALEDDEAMEARAEKKRRKEEEEKKKKAESRAIKQLKKVDTSGMQKMSSFFTKTALKKT